MSLEIQYSTKKSFFFFLLSYGIHYLDFKIPISKTSSLIHCYFICANNPPVLQVAVALYYYNTFWVLPDWAWSTWWQGLSRVPWKIIPSVLCLNDSIPNNPDLVKHFFSKAWFWLPKAIHALSFGITFWIPYPASLELLFCAGFLRPALSLFYFALEAMGLLCNYKPLLSFFECFPM